MNIGILKKYKPITPSMRHAILVNKSYLLRSNLKFLSTNYQPSAGRNHTGKITVRHLVGFTKKRFRYIDFYYNQYNIPAKVLSIEYDPQRSAFINLLSYDNGYMAYKLSTHKIEVGQTLCVTRNVRFDIGYSSELKYIPEGSLIHNIELRPDRGGSLVRAAGIYAILLSKKNGVATLKLPSKELKEVSWYCKATIGIVSNIYHRDQVLGKAGRSVRLGRKPVVRGVAMNPVDHPHGGGEGKRSNKKEVFNYTGRIIRGRKTRRSYQFKHIVNKKNRIYL